MMELPSPTRPMKLMIFGDEERARVFGKMNELAGETIDGPLPYIRGLEIRPHPFGRGYQHTVYELPTDAKSQQLVETAALYRVHYDVVVIVTDFSRLADAESWLDRLSRHGFCRAAPVVVCSIGGPVGLTIDGDQLARFVPHLSADNFAMIGGNDTREDLWPMAIERVIGTAVRALHPSVLEQVQRNIGEFLWRCDQRLAITHRRRATLAVGSRATGAVSAAVNNTAQARIERTQAHASQAGAAPVGLQASQNRVNPEDQTTDGVQAGAASISAAMAHANATEADTRSQNAKRRERRRKARKNRNHQEEPSALPFKKEDLECPISFELMTGPVVAEDGRTYQRAALLALIAHATDTGTPLRSPMHNMAMGPGYFSLLISTSRVSWRTWLKPASSSLRSPSPDRRVEPQGVDIHSPLLPVST